MKRVFASLLIFVVILVTTASLITPAVTQATIRPPEPVTLQTTKLHGLNIPPGLNKNFKIKAVVIIKGSTPYSDVLKIYNTLKKKTVTVLGKKLSIVASALRRNSKGDYVIKVIGPIGEIVSSLKPYKNALLGLSERPLINFETALLEQTPKLKNYLITDSDKEPDISKIKPGTNNFFIRYLIGAAQVNSGYHINGTGIRVAVVDTGVDYGNPDLQGALDYYVGKYNGTYIREPLVLDADENLVILFKTFTANATGYINVSGVIFNDYIPQTVNLTAPYSTYYVGNITSASGNYKFGVLYEYMDGMHKWIKVGVLLADPTTAGNYTTLYIDANNNSIFNDPEDIKVTYDGNRILAAYKPGSTWPYASYGVAGGFFIDVGWHFRLPSQAYAGWNLKGRYLSIFYDFYGHGTSCAAAIASRSFPEGIAPGAKIIGVKGLWFGDVELGMLWAAGFNISGFTPQYTGSPRAYIISNSWGISNFAYDIAGFGYDFESMFINALSTPHFLDYRYPGVLIVQAAGNGGAGYGTVTSPGAAIGALTVGASTSTHLYHYYWGFGGIAYDDIVSWSARGPTPAGYVKPDVVNVGAWGLTAAPVWLSGGNYTIFGGTSYATPLTAGVAALVYQAILSSIRVKIILHPWVVKQIIMNTAVNLHYPPFDEGAGRVNALAAVNLALHLAGTGVVYHGLRIYSYSTYVNAVGKIESLWSWMLSDYFRLMLFNWYGISLPRISLSNLIAPSSFRKYYSVYVPDIPRGGMKYFQLTLENERETTAVVKAEAIKPVRIGGPITYYLRFNLPKDETWTYKYIVISPSQIPKDTQYMTVDVVMPYRTFDGDNDYQADYYIGVVAYVWIADSNHNGVPDVNERVVVNFGYSLSNHNLVQVKLPLQLLKQYGPNAKLLIRVFISRGNDKTPAVPELKYQMVKAVVTYYGFEKDNWVKLLMPLPGNRIAIPAASSVTIKGWIRPPFNAAPTAYQDYIKLDVTFRDGETTTYYVPMSYTVYLTLRSGWSSILNTGPGAATTPYSWLYLKGDTAWDWRYESGDWRVFYVNIADPRVWMLQVQAMWFNRYMDLMTYTLGPDGQFAGLYNGSGISFNYYLGSGKFLWIDTGRYNSPVTLSTISFPVTTYRVAQYPTHKPNTGVYTILTRTVLFSGMQYREPFKLYVRALPSYNMLPNTVMPTQGSLTKYVRLPYRVSSIKFYFIQVKLPITTSQRACSYSTLKVTPTEYTRPLFFYRYTLQWGGLNCVVPFKEPRVDLAVLYMTTIPYLTVYYKYGNVYQPYTDTYVFQDWMTTGSSSYGG